MNDEHGELLELLAAHAELNRLTNELADARERRRVAAQRLVDRGDVTREASRTRSHVREAP